MIRQSVNSAVFCWVDGSKDLTDQSPEVADLFGALNVADGLKAVQKVVVFVSEDSCLQQSNFQLYDMAIKTAIGRVVERVNYENGAAQKRFDEFARKYDRAKGIYLIDPPPQIHYDADYANIWVIKKCDKEKWKCEKIDSVLVGMEDIVITAKRLARQNCRIWIAGETGTGKTELARIIYKEWCKDKKHKGGKDKWFEINIAEYRDSNLLASQLFGYAPGTFTDQRKEGKPGIFEEAHKGFLFVDEIAECAPEVQSMLLSTLSPARDQETEIESPCSVQRMGANERNIFDVRLIFATNKDIVQMMEMEKGGFRRDLYYRMAEYTIRTRALREILNGDGGRDNFIRIVEKSLEKVNASLLPASKRKDFIEGKLGERGELSYWPKCLDEEAEELLVGMDFSKGNARQLQIVLRRACVNAEIKYGTDSITAEIIKEAVGEIEREMTVGQTMSTGKTCLSSGGLTEIGPSALDKVRHIESYNEDGVCPMDLAKLEKLVTFIMAHRNNLQPPTREFCAKELWHQSTSTIVRFLKKFNITFEQVVGVLKAVGPDCM